MVTLSPGRGTKSKFEGFGFDGSMVIALIPDGVEVKKTWWPSSASYVARWNNWKMCLESFDANTAIWRVEVLGYVAILRA